MDKKPSKKDTDNLSVDEVINFVNNSSVDEMTKLRFDLAKKGLIKALKYYRDNKPKNKDDVKERLKLIAKMRKKANKNNNDYTEIISLCDEIENDIISYNSE